MEAPAAIPGFGVVALKTRAMQIRMPVFGTLRRHDTLNGWGVYIRYAK